MARVPFLLNPRYRAHVIVFASRRDGKWLGWGIYSEYPLAQKHDGTQTEQKLLFVVDAESYERAEKTAEFIVGNDVRLPGNNPRFFALSQILRKTVLQEASHDTPSGKNFAQAAMGILCGFVLYAGCFNPNLAAAKFKCDNSHLCPDGLACVDQVCIEASDQPRDLSAIQTDGFTSDLSGSVDLFQPAVGCRNGIGTDLNNGSSACPGLYEAGTDPAKFASHLCAPGYAICTLGSAVNLASCAGLAGFFLADVPTKLTFPTVSCGKATTETPGFAGCGTGGGSMGVYSVPSCNGFSRSMFYMGGNNLVIVTPNATLDGTATNTDPKNGVLCCK